MRTLSQHETRNIAGGVHPVAFAIGKGFFDAFVFMLGTKLLGASGIEGYMDDNLNPAAPEPLPCPPETDWFGPAAALFTAGLVLGVGIGVAYCRRGNKS